jgi:aspartate-semialdehyde dehydrogenase
MSRFRVGILGATGAVGQKFIHLLQTHPWFEVAALGASERSAGKRYAEAVNWIEPVLVPPSVADMTVQACDPALMPDLDLVFSGLDAGVATDIEAAYARAGIPVISNAKNYRMDPTVPLLVPEVNPDHTALIRNQEFDASGKGFIVTNPNCVAVPLAMAFRPLHDAYGVETAVVTTLQSVSGAGYPGVASLDILSNVIPYIGGEEPKIAEEPRKLLSVLRPDGSLLWPDITIQATATRVPTIEGHLLTVVAKLKNPPASIDEVKELFRNFRNPIASYGLPSAPEHPILLMDDDRYPQPRRHAYLENGMTVSVGRLRMSSVFDVAFVALGHNTVRGAAGVAILNAELLVAQGYLRH